MKLSTTVITVACAIMIGSLPLSAATLADYLPVGVDGGTGQFAFFQDGDKKITFTSFQITATCFDSGGSFTCPADGTAYLPVTAAGLTVLPSDTQGISGLGLFGFVLSGVVRATSYIEPAGGPGHQAGDQVRVIDDIQLAYTVEALSGLISDLHLQVGGDVIVGANSSLQVGETAQPGSLSLQVTDPPSNLASTLNIPSPINKLTVTKDITVTADACRNCSAAFSALEQSFSQVPEPRAYAFILGLGLLTLLLRRKSETTNS